MSSYPPKSPTDAAAHALSSLSISNAREQRYGPGEGPPSNYPQSYNTGPYPSQGVPYLASPISGVVTGDPYSPPASAYTQPPPYENHDYNKPDAKGPSRTRPSHGSPAPPYSSSYPPPDPYQSSYAPSAPHDLNLPENLDVFTGREKTKESSYPPQYYGGSPAVKYEEYPSAPPKFAPKFNESNPGDVAYSNFSSYGGTPPASAVPYSQPERHDGQGKQKTKKEFDSPPPNYEGASPFPVADQPHSGYPPGGKYPPLSGSHNQSGVPAGYPPQQTGEQHPPPAGHLPQNVGPGEQANEQTVSSSSENFPGGDSEKGFKHGQHGQYGQHGQQGYGGYPQYGYAQPAYSQPGYGQPMYPQPGYEAYPSHGYAPSYPPAYAAHGYAPEGYPSHGHGVPGYVQPAHGGHGMSHHAPGPYEAYGAAPYYGGHGSYKQHKGGHKGYKHKKMKKGHYVHYEQPHGGHHGGHHVEHYGGHHGGHEKHHHGKHKH